jgi:hypothetical protein
MPDFFASSRLLRRPALLLVTLLAASPACAEETSPLRAVTNAIGLTAPASDRPDFIRESRPDEEKMDFVPFLAPEKKRIPVKTPAQAAADDADLVAAKTQAQARLKKLQSESVEQLAPAPKPPTVQDKF